MKQTILKWCFVAVFFAASITLSLGILLDGPSKAGANEQLSKPPVLFSDDGTYNPDFLSDAAAWVGDHFFLRQELITLDNRLTAAFFSTSGAEDVVLGRDGWLYYDSTMDNYTGQDLMTDRELFSAATNLEMMANYCRDHGKQFLFVIAPNKNSLYPENMPNTGIANPRQDAESLHKALTSRQIPYVDLFALFDAQEDALYFAHDSHWNSKGAALGADLINEAFGVESSYFEGDFSYKVAHDGDLYAMVYPGLQDTEMNPVYGGRLDYTFKGMATQPDAIVLNTEGQGSGKLLCYRDSFGILLFPYLADSYGSAKFSRVVNYDLTGDEDYVAIELVERNLRYLIQNVPVMPAPVRTMELPQTVSGTAQAAVDEAARAGEGCVQLRGTLPKPADADSCVYVVCSGVVYEAFCLENGGFAANVPESAAPQYIIYNIGGVTQMFEIQ